MLRFTILITLLFFISTFVVTLHAQETSTDVEPNNSRDNAVLIDGYVIEGYVGSGSDFSDWYVLAGQQTGTPTIKLIYDASNYDIDVIVYSDDQEIGKLIMPTSPDENTFDIPGTCYIEVVAYTDGEGGYEILINGGSAEPIDDSARQAECAGPSEVEPNDQRMQATGIEEFTIDGFICDGDTDWYITHGQEGVNPKISVEYNDSECDIDVVVYSDYTVANTLASVTSPDSENFTVPGTCWIKVFSWSGTGEYSINIEPQDMESSETVNGKSASDPCQGYNEFEPNDEKNLADFISGLEILGHACENDVDWFVLDGQEGTGPWIEIHYDLPTDIDMEIWDDNEKVGTLQSSESPDRGRFEVEGKCYLKVWAHHGEGDYRITIIPDTAPPDPSETET